MQTPDDLDLVTRTVLAEAGNQGPVGMAAVAAVIKNRMAKNRMAAGDVVLQHNQFEPWNRNHIGGGNDPMRFSPDDPKYRQAQEITQRVMSGDLADPTKGATHFANVGTVRQRNAGTVGNHGWINPRNETARIGAHTFFAPEGRVMNGFNQEMTSQFWRNPSSGGMPGGGVTGGVGGNAGMPDASMSTPQGQMPQPSVMTGAGGGAGGGAGKPPVMGADPGAKGQPPILGRLLFGDGGLNGFMKQAIPTPFGGQGMIGGAMNGLSGAMGGAGGASAAGPMVLPGVAASSAAPALASAAAPAAAGAASAAAPAAAAGASGVGAMLSSLLALI